MSQVCGTYPGITPEVFARLPMPTLRALMRHSRTVHMQRLWGEAQTALLVARTMGGHEGNELAAFLPAWAQPAKARPRPLVSRDVDNSIRTALGLGLVSQDALDLLTEVGFQL